MAPNASMAAFLSAWELMTLTSCPAATNFSVSALLIFPKEPVTVIVILYFLGVAQN
jgi:hypothetical protein